MKKPANPAVPRLLRLKEVKEKTGMATSSIYAEMAAEKFPRPVRLTRRAVAWPDNLINQWISDRLST
ncbi:MAG: AlpA family phage regulatory protein [Acidimicrobiia bacterium]|nr:AlpA family phage regulatory protein [Acidimicrobiia bacterium]